MQTSRKEGREVTSCTAAGTPGGTATAATVFVDGVSWSLIADCSTKSPSWAGLILV
jgi:hypothetical protein